MFNFDEYIINGNVSSFDPGCCNGNCSSCDYSFECLGEEGEEAVKIAEINWKQIDLLQDALEKVTPYSRVKYLEDIDGDDIPF